MKLFSIKVFIIVFLQTVCFTLSFAQTRIQKQAISEKLFASAIDSSVSSVCDSNIAAVNSQSLADAFIQLPGFRTFDLGALGQSAYIGFRGISTNHSIPVFNSIPLQTFSFGTWDFNDIPYYMVQSIYTDRTNNQRIPGLYSSLFLSPYKNTLQQPYTRINYRVGDYDWNHIDILFTRKLRSDISLYSAGTSEHFPDKYSDNQYHGSNIWLNLNKTAKKYDMSLQLLAVDRNFYEIDHFPFAVYTIVKQMPHSHNVKMGAFEINQKEGNISPLKALLYYWEIKDNAQGSLLYKSDFHNKDTNTGILLEKTGEWKNGLWYTFRGNANSTRISSSFWDKIHQVHSGNICLSMNYKSPKKYSFEFIPETAFKSKSNKVPIFGKCNYIYYYSDKCNLQASISQSGRFLSAAEQSLINFKNANDIYDKIMSYEFSLKYTGRNFYIGLTPFYNRIANPYYIGYDPNISQNNPAFGRNISSINYGGIELSSKYYINKYSELTINYAYCGGEKIYLWNIPNTVYFHYKLHNAEDLFTSLNIDTRFYVSGLLTTKHYTPVYLPLYQQFVHTADFMTLNTAIIKMRGEAQIQSLVLFSELDLSSRPVYYQILGYPIYRRMLKFGLTWEFFN